jgi:hypothetical protein
MNLKSIWKSLARVCCLATLTGSLLASETPALKISASLAWEPVYTNDPLRVRVRLTCPQASQAMARQLRQAELGQAMGELTPPPAIATNWQDGVQLTLSAVDTNKVRHVILSADQWPLYLRPLLDEPPSFDGLVTARSREWLLPATVAGLTNGNYVLAIQWSNSGLVDTNALPAGGTLTGQELAFRVQSPTNAAEQATHLGRLAYQDYMAGQTGPARTLGQQALQLDPNNLDPERVETYFVVAHSAIRQQDYLGGADVFQSMFQAYGTNHDEILTIAHERLNLLAPQLRVPAGAAANPAAFRFQLLTLPSQHYLAYGSTNLQQWQAISTNLGTGDWIEITDTNAWQYKTRYYRAVLTP